METPAQHGQTQEGQPYSKRGMAAGLMLWRISPCMPVLWALSLFSPYSRLAMPSGRMSTPTALTDTPAGVFAMKQGDEDTMSGPASGDNVQCQNSVEVVNESQQPPGSLNLSCWHGVPPCATVHAIAGSLSQTIRATLCVTAACSLLTAFVQA